MLREISKGVQKVAKGLTVTRQFFALTLIIVFQSIIVIDARADCQGSTLPIFQEDFGGTLSAWEKNLASGASFAIANGELVQSNTSPGIPYNDLYVPSGFSWSDYRVTFKTRHVSNFYSVTALGINIRRQPGGSSTHSAGYNLQLHGGGFVQLYKYDGTGHSVQLQISPSTLPVPNYAGYQVVVDATGDWIRVWVDGVKYIDVHDATYSTGTIGLETVHVAGAFDDVSIVSTCTSSAIVPSSAPAVEYYHAGFGHYFVTGAADEAAAIDSGAIKGWARTGQTYSIYSQGGADLSPVCRFFTTTFAPKSSHFYTPSAAECAGVKTNPNWQFEGNAFYVNEPVGGSCPGGTAPLYRIYNNGHSGAPNHRYTTCTTILDNMVAHGWVSEGVAMCVPGGSVDCATDNSGGGVDYNGGQNATPAASCTTTLSSYTQSVGPGESTLDVAVTTPATCDWTTTTSAVWMFVTSGESGKGDGVVSIWVQPNTTATPRMGTLSIGGVTFAVTQASAAVCTGKGCY